MHNVSYCKRSPMFDILESTINGTVFIDYTAQTARELYYIHIEKLKVLKWKANLLSLLETYKKDYHQKLEIHKQTNPSEEFEYTFKDFFETKNIEIPTLLPGIVKYNLRTNFKLNDTFTPVKNVKEWLNRNRLATSKDRGYERYLTHGLAFTYNQITMVKNKHFLDNLLEENKDPINIEDFTDIKTALSVYNDNDYDSLLLDEVYSVEDLELFGYFDDNE